MVHNGVTSYCGLFNQQVRYSRGCVFAGVWYGWLNHHGVITYWELSNRGVMRCILRVVFSAGSVMDGWKRHQGVIRSWFVYPWG